MFDSIGAISNLKKKGSLVLIGALREELQKESIQWSGAIIIIDSVTV